MVLPQFSLRMALGLMAVMAFVSLVVARGLQGSPWAMGVSVALFAIVSAFLSYALIFAAVYMISLVWNRRRRSGPAPDAGGEASPRKPADLVPPAIEYT